MKNSSNTYIDYQKKLELCKKIINSEYEKYRHHNWVNVHYRDADFFDTLEKNHLITSFYGDVFNEAYERFLETQTQSEYIIKMTKIKNFLLEMSNTLKKII